MPMRQVELSEDFDRFIQAQVEARHSQDAGKGMRQALLMLEREAQEYDVRVAAVRAAIAEGGASGVMEVDIFALARARSLETADQR